MINKYNTWLLAGLELLFSCSNHTRRNTIYNSLYIFIMAEFVLKPQRKIPKKFQCVSVARSLKDRFSYSLLTDNGDHYFVSWWKKTMHNKSTNMI